MSWLLLAMLHQWVERSGGMCCWASHPDGDETVLHLLFPATLREEVLTDVHQKHGHQGVEKTLELLRQWCYWSGVTSEVAQWCQACDRCQVAKDKQPVACSFMGYLLASRPHEILAMDYTVLEPTQSGLKNVLVMNAAVTGPWLLVCVMLKKKIKNLLELDSSTLVNIHVFVCMGDAVF